MVRVAMEHMVQMHRFPRWWKTRLMCDGCYARNPACKNCGDMTYLSFGDDAKWRPTVITHEQYMEESIASGLLSPFAKIDGFNYELLFRDWAHMVPLGIGRDFGGASIKSMFKCVSP